MGKVKYYVVWKGYIPGVYDKWEDCKAQIGGFAEALYKSFPTREEALSAYGDSPYAHIGKDQPSLKNTLTVPVPRNIETNSICVDAAWNTETKVMEYRGVYTATRKEIFHAGPFYDATNNIGEFLAIVHGLALLKQKNKDIPVYTDSKTAMVWVKNRKAKTKLLVTPRNACLFDLLSRAEKWLQENQYRNRIIKWETASWGEIPADFGRK